MTDFNKSIETLKDLDVSKMYGEDFFLTWEKSEDELTRIVTLTSSSSELQQALESAFKHA